MLFLTLALLSQSPTPTDAPDAPPEVVCPTCATCPTCPTCPSCPTCPPPQPTPAVEPWEFEVSVSPLFYFLLGGYHFALSARPPDTPLRLVATSFALQIPETGLGENQGEGWSHRHRAPLVVGADVFPLPWKWWEGAFLGALVAPHFNSYAREGEELSQLEIYMLPRVGYQLFPLEFFDVPRTDIGVFAQLWVGAGVPVDRNDDIVLAGETWVPRAISVVPNIELGWSF